MTAAQHGQAGRRCECEMGDCPDRLPDPPVPVPDPDVREAVARIAANLRALADHGDPVMDDLRLLADELLAVVGQASKADEAEVDVTEGGEVIRPEQFVHPEDQERQRRALAARAAVQPEVASKADEACCCRSDGFLPLGLTCKVHGNGRGAVVQPAQPDDDGLRQRVEAVLTTAYLRSADDDSMVVDADDLRLALDGASGDQQDGAR